MKNVFYINIKISVLSALVLFLVGHPGTISAADKAVITSVSVSETVPNVIVNWNQLEPIEECFVELTDGIPDNFYIFYSPPEDPVLCDTVGTKTKIVTLDRVQGIIPLYTVIVDNITGDIISQFVNLRNFPPSYNPSPKGVVGHRPEVSIDSPISGAALGPTTTIRYGVVDVDDYDYPPFGLGDKPVEIFYSDDKESWISIAKDLPKSGEYQWKSSDVPDGKYWIKIKAIDLSLDNDEEIAGPFPIDRIQPSFEIFAEPAVSRGEKIKIFAVASEELQKNPQVFAKQRNYVDIEVSMHPASDEEIKQHRMLLNEATSDVAYATVIPLYLGEYEVRPGYDGTAQIKISGQDKAGNTGRIIRRGGTFSVGIQPPPPPVIIEPLDKEIFATSTVNIRGGQVREDTKVVLVVNEVAQDVQGQQDSVLAEKRPSLVGRLETRPDTTGNFFFENIPLSETFNNGENILKIFSEDVAGNTSEPVILSIKRNVEPELNIINPESNALVSGTTTISFSARDKNLDKLFFDIETSNDGGQTWKNLAKDFPRTSFEWLTFLGPDGKYILRVTASDGIAKVIAVSAPFIVRNNAPGFFFTDDKPIISNTGKILISGIASSSIKRITNVDYRLQGPTLTDERSGSAEWQAATAIDGAFDGLNERFQISLQGLPEGSYELEVRARDNRRYYGYGEKRVIVDFGPPQAPVVETVNQQPTTNNRQPIISDFYDNDSEKAGAQVLVGGGAEKNNIIEILQNSVLTEKRPGLGKFSGRSDENGNFSIPITLRRHGQNIFKIKAIDGAGNESPEKEFSIIYNNPPIIRAIEPRDNDGLHGQTKIIWEAQDKDLDPIAGYNIYWKENPKSEILNPKQIPNSKFQILNSDNWKLLASNLKSPEFIWDVSKFQEGFYELKIEATDGVSTGEKILKLFVDNTKPQAAPNFPEKTIFNTKNFRLQFTGSATDNFSGVQAVEYRIRQNQDLVLAEKRPSLGFGSEWYQSVITSGFRENRASFRVSHPFQLKDGEYEIQVRAVDVAGNISEIKSQKITIDTTPPRIGPTQVLYKNFEIIPKVASGKTPPGKVDAAQAASTGVAPTPDVEEGAAIIPVYEILEGAEITLRQSLESDTAVVKVKIEETEYPLQKSAKTGLWEAKGGPALSVIRPGLTMEGLIIKMVAEDFAGNKTKKEIGRITVLKKGIVKQHPMLLSEATSDVASPLEKAKITVKIFDPEQHQFINWNAQEYGEENPLVTDANGQYSLFLTPGTYKMEVKKPRYQTQTTKEFTIENSKFINFDFELKPRKGIKGFIQNLLERFFGE